SLQNWQSFFREIHEHLSELSLHLLWIGNFLAIDDQSLFLGGQGGLDECRRIVVNLMDGMEEQLLDPVHRQSGANGRGSQMLNIARILCALADMCIQPT